MHLHNCRCFLEHLRLLLQSLKAHCKAPGGPGSIWKYIEALVGGTGVSVRFACGFRTDLHFGDALGRCDQVKLEMNFETMFKRDWMSAWKQLMDDAPGAESLFISWLTLTGGNVRMWLYLGAPMGSCMMAVDRVRTYAGSSSYIQGSTPNHVNEGKTINLGLMLYLRYAVLGVCCIRCQLMIMARRDREG